MHNVAKFKRRDWRSHLCLRPWKLSKRDNPVALVRQHFVNFHQYFDSGRDIEEHSMIEKPGGVASSKNSVQVADDVTRTPPPTSCRFSIYADNAPKPVQETCASNGSNTEPAVVVPSPSASTLSPAMLVDNNNVLNKDTADTILAAFQNRDMEKFPLLKHEESLLELLIMDGNTIRLSTTQIMEPLLKGKENGSLLADHELRLLGQLAYKGFKSIDCENKRLVLKSFERYNPFQIARVPEMYGGQTDNKMSMKKSHDRHVDTAAQWMDHLPGSFGDELMISFCLEKKKEMKALIARHHPGIYRLNATETLVLQSFVSLNEKQIDKLGRVSFHLLGLRLLAPRQQRIDLKNSYIMTHFTSLQHHNVVMEKKVKAGKKDTVMRDTYVTVNKIDPLECVAVKMESLVQGKKLLPSKSRYKQHWHIYMGFEDSVAWALKFDAGGGSTKGTINPVNVERPQSQNHIMPILEFGGGVKDTDSNMRKACFKKGDMV